MTPTGSLMVLDAGDVLAAARTFNLLYPRRVTRELTDVDKRRAWSLLTAARAELAAMIPRLELELDYTRASVNPDTEESESCFDASTSGSASLPLPPSP